MLCPLGFTPWRIANPAPVDSSPGGVQPAHRRQQNGKPDAPFRRRRRAYFSHNRPSDRTS